MPFYDYRCPANGRTVEVRHSMDESVSDWGDLCRLADVDPGETAVDTPVERVVGVPGVGPRRAEPSGGGGGCCCSGGCGH